MSRVMDKKRKRPVGAPRRVVSEQKRLKRAAAYHSSSEEDEVDNRAVEDAEQLAGIGQDEEEDQSGEESGGVKFGNFRPNQRSIAELSSDAPTGSVPEAGTDNNGDEIDADTEDEVYDDDSEMDGAALESDEESTLSTGRQRPKRADPQAFATSIKRILNSKLTTTKRADPVLSRSKAAQQTVREQADSRLEEAARRKMRADKHAKREQGRVKDVLGLQSANVSTGEVVEEERRLKRLAQKGVVKLFNAVRAAQGTAHEAETGAKKQGMIGIDRRKEKVDEMSKKGFLDLLSGSADA